MRGYWEVDDHRYVVWGNRFRAEVVIASRVDMVKLWEMAIARKGGDAQVGDIQDLMTEYMEPGSICRVASRLRFSDI